MMQTRDAPLFTPTEAAVLTRLSIKAVHNAIDKKAIPTFTGKKEGHATRLLDLRALMSLALERRLADRFVPQARREVFDALAKARNTVTLEGGFLKIDLREPRRELATSLRELRRARQLVVNDPDIMGGEPVFRGTRIPVHLIASLLEQGTPEAELCESYPRLTPEMVHVAPLYAMAYPPRGRPRRQPWHGQTPTHRARRKLVTIEAA
jgi:uncharacterized protein (DUF433 family)